MNDTTELDLALGRHQPILPDKREGRIQSAERAVPTFNRKSEFTNLLSAC
jgi:hypothetical protein